MKQKNFIIALMVALTLCLTSSTCGHDNSPANKKNDSNSTSNDNSQNNLSLFKVIVGTWNIGLVGEKGKVNIDTLSLDNSSILFPIGTYVFNSNGSGNIDLKVYDPEESQTLKISFTYKIVGNRINLKPVGSIDDSDNGSMLVIKFNNNIVYLMDSEEGENDTEAPIYKLVRKK